MAPNDVKIHLNYSVDLETSLPLSSEKNEPAKKGLIKPKEVSVKDGRSTQATLDDHSFELVEFDTSFKTEDFYSEPSRIETEYFREMEECIKRSTGAELVKCFDYLVRNKSKFEPEAKDGRIEDYARGIHTDLHEESAHALFSFLTGDLDERFQRGRFVCINAWRNIRDEPLEKNHLAVLDAKSLSGGIGSEDYLENCFGHKSMEKFFVLNEKNSASHEWHYFPRMRKEEVLLFKQWDSDPERRAMTCFHAAFDDPRVAGDEAAKPPRESIEVRAIAFFPDHAPNTCPKVEPVDVEDAFGFKRGSPIFRIGWRHEQNKFFGL